MEATSATDLQVDLAFFASGVGEEGSITHIHEGNLSVGHLFRAAFERMAEYYYTCALRLAPEQRWPRLVFSGGLAQQLAILPTIIQRRFQRPYRVSLAAEDTLLGLLALALAWSGRVSSVAAAAAAVQEAYRGSDADTAA